jgi:hypothetical protein
MGYHSKGGTGIPMKITAQTANPFATIGGEQDTTPVDKNRVDANVGTFAEAILNIKNMIAAAIKAPAPNETFLNTPTNHELAEKAVAALNVAFNKLKGVNPPPAADPSGGDGPVSTMLYGEFLFNRIQEAVTQIGQEIAKIKAAQAAGVQGLDAGLKKLNAAHGELSRIHSTFVNHPAFAAFKNA